MAVEFKLGGDTYAMAYKALHWESAQAMNLSQNEILNAYHSSAIVTCIQMLMLIVVANVMFGEKSGPPVPGPHTDIVMARTVMILSLRFVCCMLMHLNVESDVRQGLKMMKYCANHSEDFSAPTQAFFVGFMQMTTGILTELACICFLGTINDEMMCIIRYMAVSSIARVDDIYANALPDDNNIKSGSPPLKIKFNRRGLNQ